MSNRDEIKNLLTLYRERSGVHGRRYILLLERQSQHLKKWVALVKNHPVNSDEFQTEVNKLWNQSKNLADEFAEVTTDLSEDNDLLIKFFEEMQPYVK